MRGGLRVVLFAAALCVGGCSPKSVAPPPEPPVEQYRRAVARLTGDGGPASDPELRKAFVAVLNDLAERSDPAVHLAVADVADPADPPEAAVDLAVWTADFEFRPLGGGKDRVFPQDVVFGGGEFADSRRKELVDLVQHAVRSVADENLLRLVPLPAGAARDGKPLLDLRVTSRRGGAYKKVHLINSPYLMRDFHLDWEMKLSDGKGHTLATTATTRPGPLEAQIERGAWEYENLEGQVRTLAGVVYRAQLASAYGEFRQTLDRKLGASPR